MKSRAFGNLWDWSGVNIPEILDTQGVDFPLSQSSHATFGLAGRGVPARKPCPAAHVPGPQVSFMVVEDRIPYADTWDIRAVGTEALHFVPLWNLSHIFQNSEFSNYGLCTWSVYRIFLHLWLWYSTNCVSMDTINTCSQFGHRKEGSFPEVVQIHPQRQSWLWWIHHRKSYGSLDRLEVGVYGSKGFALHFGRTACMGSCASAGPSPLRLPCPGQTPVKRCERSAPLVESM